jgi:hypothetical protein
LLLRRIDGQDFQIRHPVPLTLNSQRSAFGQNSSRQMKANG